jgi:hypothetical protein
VRIGNGAYDQRQNDVFGAVLDSILLHTRKSERLPQRSGRSSQTQAECATKVWASPTRDLGGRGAPQHYVSSKLMCWVALDRAREARRDRGGDHAGGVGGDRGGDHGRRSSSTASRRAASCDSHYDTDSLDASVLLAGDLRVPPGDDARLHRPSPRSRPT